MASPRGSAPSEVVVFNQEVFSGKGKSSVIVLGAGRLQAFPPRLFIPAARKTAHVPEEPGGPRLLLSLLLVSLL